MCFLVRSADRPREATLLTNAPSPATLEVAEEMLHLMLAHATDGVAEVADYRRCRASLVADTSIKKLVPPFVRTCRDPGAFWSFIKTKISGAGSYQARREFLRDAFEPLLQHLERAELSPLDEIVGEATAILDAESVTDAWTKALERKTVDPEGAITAARALLESVCKTILDDRDVAYERKDDLPTLYSRVSKELRLAPSDHTEKQFKAILGACATVVSNLGSVRNQASDAHGRGRNSYKPAERHAALAVNLAGSMALFLIETHQFRQ